MISGITGFLESIQLSDSVEGHLRVSVPQEQDVLFPRELETDLHLFFTGTESALHQVAGHSLPLLRVAGHSLLLQAAGHLLPRLQVVGQLPLHRAAGHSLPRLQGVDRLALLRAVGHPVLRVVGQSVHPPAAGRAIDSCRSV